MTADPKALEETYAEEWNSAFEDGWEVGYAERLAQLILQDGQGSDTDWALGFSDGWSAGRQDAAAAMRQVAVDEDLSPLRIEWRVLDIIDRTAALP